MPIAEYPLPNVAFEAPHGSSPFRALVWKEWRQQRQVYLIFVCLAYLLRILSRVLPTSPTYGLLDWHTVMLGGGTLVGVMAVLVLSANAFAGERDDETDQFLDMIPYARSKVFWVKLGFVLFLIVAAFVPIGFWILAHASSLKLSPYFIDYIPISAIVAVLLIVPPLIASFGVSVIATILISIPVATACAAWAKDSHRILEAFLPLRSGTSSLLSGAILPPLIIATLLLAALRSWSRIERTRRRAAWTSAAAGGLMVACVAVPVIPVWLYVTCIAPLSFFMNSTSGIANGYVSSTSPDGKHVLVFAHSSVWGKTTRTALVEADFGGMQWLTRFRDSEAYFRVWSPSANQFVVIESRTWLRPLAQVSWDEPVTYFIVDANSGATRRLDELCPGMPKWPPQVMSLVGWYGEQVIAFSVGRDILFADIERHQVKDCKMPYGWDARNIYLPVMTRRGVFALPVEGALRTLRVLHYAPNLSEAESITLHGLSGALSWIEASEDGQWLLLRPSQPERWRSQTCYLAKAVDGAEAELLVSGDAAEAGKGLIAASWRVSQFLPGGHDILLYRNEAQGLHLVDSEEQMGCELGLFNADTRKLRRIPLPKTWSLISRIQLSPKGNYALVSLGQGANYAVVNLESTTAISFPWANMWWLGEDRLLADSRESKGAHFIVVNRDGTGARPLLAK